MSCIPNCEVRIDRAVVAAILLCGACSPSTESADQLATGEILHPDTATVDGVMQLRFAADAFERAPQLTLDSSSVVTIEGGEDLDFELSSAKAPQFFADGRALVVVTGKESRLLLFNADGTPDRVIARNGEGPGDIGSGAETLRLSGDTMWVTSIRNNLVTADSGIVYSEAFPTEGTPWCFRPVELMPDRRALATSTCKQPTYRGDSNYVGVSVVSLSLDHSDADTLVVLRGQELRPATMDGLTRLRPVRFSSMPLVMVWGEDIATNPDSEGYRIDRRSTDGTLVAQLVLERPRRVVTEALIDAHIDLEAEQRLEFAGSGAGPEYVAELKEAFGRLSNADSLPGFARLYSGTNGTLWAYNFSAATDTSWSAVAFDSNGSMLGVLTVSFELGELASIQDDKVILKSTDDDGFVKFGVYGVSGL